MTGHSSGNDLMEGQRKMHETPSRDERFCRHACACAQFLQDHGRLPPWGSLDADGVDLGAWLARCRFAATGGLGSMAWSLKRQKVLDELLPGWSAQGREGRFHQRAQEYADFVVMHSRRPKLRAFSGPERGLATWMKVTRLRARGEGITLLRRGYLDRLIPDWDLANPDHRGDRAFRDRAEDYAGFVELHGRCPSYRKTDRVERSLADWIQRVRSNAKGKSRDLTWTPERQQILDELIPDWEKLQRPTGSDVDRFILRARECATFVAQHDRWPVKDTTDSTERSLAVWLVAARAARRGNPSAHMAWSTQREELLDKLLPGWTARHPKPFG